MDEENVKELVEKIVTALEGLIDDDDDSKMFNVKWFLSELYQRLNSIYNIDGNQEVKKEVVPVQSSFFWEIDKEWNLSKRWFKR